MTFPASDDTSSVDDPLVPWLRSIRKALEDKELVVDLRKLLSDCIITFKDDSRYKDDPRFLKIWLLHLESGDDIESALKEMEEHKICEKNSSRYELSAVLLEVRENWMEAYNVYQIGLSRKAQPLDRLKDALALFLQRISHRLNHMSHEKIDREMLELRRHSVNPWSTITMDDLMKKITPQLMKYDGYHLCNKAYSGDVALPSLRNAPRNKIIKIGGKKYQIKGRAGKGGFAQVFRACVDGNPEDVIALKIQAPAFPWEFYMYRQLDHRISGKQRSSFGCAHRMHLYSDCSILVCDYFSHGTLQDVINSYVVIGKSMEEVLCIYYTVEMLHMLESLHNAGIVHGDFKPDNLLIRYSRDNLVEDKYGDRDGPWGDQGLCLVDWGRGIDLHLFPNDIEFEGDCQTSGFCCVEMQEEKKWKFQVDTYGLCVIVHMMLHNCYMHIEKKVTSDGSYIYRPKASFKRYWNVKLWENLFTKLLNSSPNYDKELLSNLRKDFQDYLCSNNKLLRELKGLLAKQRMTLCSV